MCPYLKKILKGFLEMDRLPTNETSKSLGFGVGLVSGRNRFWQKPWGQNTKALEPRLRKYVVQCPIVVWKLMSENRDNSRYEKEGWGTKRPPEKASPKLVIIVGFGRRVLRPAIRKSTQANLYVKNWKKMQVGWVALALSMRAVQVSFQLLQFEYSRRGKKKVRFSNSPSAKSWRAAAV